MSSNVDIPPTPTPHSDPHLLAFFSANNDAGSGRTIYCCPDYFNEVGKDLKMLSSAKVCGNLKGYKHRAYYRLRLHAHKYCLLNLCPFRMTDMAYGYMYKF